MPLAHDSIPVTGNAGTVTATIGGTVYELAEIKNVTATITFNKTAYKVMGSQAERHKAAGWTGAGDVSYHWVSPRFQRMIIEAAKTGVQPYFSMTITNDDAGSSAGTQSIWLGQVNIDGGDIAKLELDADMLEGSYNFTFSEVDGLSYFDDI